MFCESILHDLLSGSMEPFNGGPKANEIIQFLILRIIPNVLSYNIFGSSFSCIIRYYILKRYKLFNVIRVLIQKKMLIQRKFPVYSYLITFPTLFFQG